MLPAENVMDQIRADYRRQLALEEAPPTPDWRHVAELLFDYSEETLAFHTAPTALRIGA